MVALEKPAGGGRVSRTTWRLLLGLATAVCLACSAGGAAIAETPQMRYVLQDVRALLKKKAGLPLDVRTKADQLERYYSTSDAQILWLNPERQSELISALSGFTATGLSNLDGSLARIESRKQALRSEDASLLALVELTFGAQFIEAAQNLRLGQMDLYREKLHRRTLERFIYTDRLLALVASGEPLTAIFARLEPQQADYQAIRTKLIEYVSIQKRGGWAALRPGPDLKEGITGPRVTELRQRLEITGELAPVSGPSDVFDTTLSEAVKKFQKQHNLPQSGIVDRRTLLALNIPVRDRVAQLIVNLERWRWFEDIPKGELWVINTNAARLEIRQADGKQEQIGIKVDNACGQSPALDSTIDHVEVAPTFMFPANLAARYVLPVLQSKPESLDPSLVIYAESSLAGIQNVNWKTYSETNFPFSISQSPGRTNLLGLFQIPLKDEGAVSIHGRPSSDPKLAIPRSLWPACVALSGPTETAEVLLKRIGADVSISSGQGSQTPSRRIDLPSSIPVVFLYATVWTDPVNGVVFGPDPLNLDGDLARKLSKFAGS